MSTELIEVTPSLPANRHDIVSVRKGKDGVIVEKVRGVKYFAGTMSAKELREAGKGLGHKGRALTVFVNTSLQDERASRLATGYMFIAAMNEKDRLPDVMEVMDNGNAALKFAPIKDAQASATTKEQLRDAESRVAELERELAALRAKALETA
jgi:hypothetical protein